MLPMSTDPMQFTGIPQPQIPGVYPFVNPYGQYMPDMSLQPDFFQMYSQMMQLPQGVLPVPPMSPSNRSESTDSGNHTLSPTHPTLQQPQNVVGPSSAAVSPQFPAPDSTTTPLHEMQKMAEQQVIQASAQHQNANPPYAINSLLSREKQEEDEKENAKSRRNTLATSTVRKPRQTPYERQNQHVAAPVPPNFTTAYSPMMMNNFAAFMDPFYRKDHCYVCADTASGHHYGVLSCEGCKGFFRRTVTRNIVYNCSKGNICTFSFANCAANRGSRTSCPACRFKRCLEVGMKREQVRAVTDKTSKKRSISPLPEAMPEEIVALVESFTANLDSSQPLGSLTHAFESTKKFITGVPALKMLFPEEEGQFNVAVQDVIAGLLTLRVSFTLDGVPFFRAENPSLPSKIESLRAGIRSTVLQNEGVALLSGLYILQVTNGTIGEIFGAYCRGLRLHLSRSQLQEEDAYDRLISTLGQLRQ
ncbi:unnamed protein product [Caenorhabditis sp. 36 PRJEB53466]|nr:unnamed protein product [Caenorhabditis sp. 36 PRJEB53466]